MKLSLPAHRSLLRYSLMLVCILFTLIGNGQIYVNDGNTTGDVFTTAIGSDANAGTAAAPFATLAKALSVASNGTVIYIDAGHYTPGSLNITRSVSILGPNHNISGVSGMRSAEAILDLSTNANGTHILLNATSAIAIKGFRIEDNNVVGTGAQRHAIQFRTSNGHVVANNIFYRSTSSPSNSASEVRAIYIDPTTSGTTITIDNNLFTGTGTGLFQNQSWRRGIWKQSGAGTINITNNKFENVRSHFNGDEQLSTTNISGNIFELGNTGTTAISLGGSQLGGPYTLGANDFRGIGTIINLSSVPAGFVLNATTSSFNGVPFSSLSLNELFTLETFIVHGMNQNRNGLVRVKAGQLFVVPAANNPLNNTVKGNIASAIALASNGDVIHIQNGTYEQDINLNKAVTLSGESRTGTVIRGTYSGVSFGASTLMISASNAKVQQLTVTRNYGSTLAEWKNSVKNQGITIGSGTNGVVLDNVEVRDQRNAIYIPNATNFVVKNCYVHDNRTGFHLGVNNSGGQIINNIIHDNFTHGLLVNFSFTPNNITNLKVNNNSFERNWISHINFNAGNNYTAVGQNFNCNWFGTTTPSLNATNTVDPGYTDQLPSQFGGTATAALNGEIRGANAGLINYSPFLASGTDTDAAPGFQPANNACGIPLSNVQLVNTSNNICYGGNTGTATISYENGFAPVQYSVNGGAPITAATSPFQVTGLTAGNYTIEVKDAGGYSATVNFTITQPAALSPGITVSRTDNTYTGVNTANTIFLGYGAQQLTFTGNATGSGINYSWSPSTHLNTTTNKIVTYSPTAAAIGNNTINLTVTDVNGCTATTAVTIKVVDVRCGNKNDKVLVCQVPQGKTSNAQTICIAPSAVKAHLAKGDYLGSCENATARMNNTTVAYMNEIDINDGSFRMSADPVPTGGRFNLRIYNAPKGKASVQVIGMNGVVADLRTVNILTDLTIVNMDLSGKAQGMYKVRTVAADGKASTITITVTR